MSDVHENVSPLIAAYALGAVPENEIPAIRSHILTCDQCFAEAEAFAEDTAILAELVEPEALPVHFEEEVLRRVREEAPERKPRTSWWARLPRLSPVTGIVAVAAVLIGLMTFSYVDATRGERQYKEAVAALVGAGDSFELKGAGGAQAVVAETQEGSVLVAVSLGEAPAGRDYQLWLMNDGVPQPADTFDAAESVVVIESSRALQGFDGAAITVEPDGGSPQPTTEPVLTSS